MNGSRRKSLVWLILVVIVFLVPVFTQDLYTLHTLIRIFFNIALATSLWMFMRTGDVSFAHAAFMGIGAYTSALLVMRLGWSFWVTMWVATAATAVIAFVVSLPLLRTRAVYFFLASWALGEVIRLIFARFEDPFGSWNGLYNIPFPELSILGLSIDFSSKVAYFYLAGVVTAAIVFLIYRLTKSRIGMIWHSIHEATLLAQHAGINILKYRILAFVIASSFAGMTGALYAHYHGYLSPYSFEIMVSEYILVYVIVGGLPTIVGPIIGATLLSALPELLKGLGFYQMFLFGIILILTIRFLPGGLVSIPQELRSLMRR